MELTTAFDDFLGSIALPAHIRARCIAAHNRLRTLLEKDPELSKIIVAVFLQGSYKRGTINRATGEKKADVDMVVVTNLNSQLNTPKQAHDKFIPFLEKHYAGKWKQQGRSLGIELEHLCLDLVVTAAPSQAAEEGLRKAAWVMDSEVTAANMETRFGDLSELIKSSSDDTWRNEPLLIPDRDEERWDQTHPLAQLAWTVDKNRACNGRFLGVVRSLKWWKGLHASDLDHPKSYPWEHLLGDCCPDGIETVGTGVTLTLEKFVQSHQHIVVACRVPESPDRGIPSKDVMARTDAADFAVFFQRVFHAAQVARTALDAATRYESAKAWAELFGPDFPVPDPPRFTERTKNTKLQDATFA